MISLKSASGVTISLLNTYYVPGLDTRNTAMNITKMATALTVLQVHEIKYNYISSYFPKCY